MADQLRLLIVAFSARFALEQLIDDFALSVSLATHCRVMVPTNYKGALPEAMLFRIECGITKVGGVLASINPIAHIHVLLALRRFRPQVVHVLTGEGYPWAMTLAAALAFARIPLVVTVHDPDPHPGSLLERLNARMRQSVLRNAVLHIYSEQHRRRVGELARSARIEVIPHGSLAGRFLAHRLDGVVRERLVLFFGRFGHYKGIDVLLRAFQHLPIDVRLALAGPGKLSETEQALVDQLGNRVELCNSYIGDEQVAYLMMRASVVALPYRHVTQSSVPAIANAFGVRVVASALGHFVEEVPALNGILVPPENPTALAIALERALAGPSCVTLSTRPSPTFAELTPAYLGLYQSTISNSR